MAQEATSRRVEPKGSFTAFMRAGLTTSQIHGDGFGGYNKLGGIAGVGTFTRISKKLEFQVEIDYTMRGSRKRPNPKTGDFTSYKIEAHYLDVPLLLKKDISFFELEFGLCNGFYLFHYEADQLSRIPKALNTWKFRRYELAAQVGLSVPISEKWFANARIHYSVLPATGGWVNVNGWNYFWGANHNMISLTINRLLIPKK